MSDIAKGIRECLDKINELRGQNAAKDAEIARLRARVEELEGALRMAAECIDADDTIAARGFLSDALIKKYKPKWVCPNNTPGCVKNCGNYGCGN